MRLQRKSLGAPDEVRSFPRGTPGEVLVSGPTHELVTGSGLRFEDRGTHQLKGIEGARQVWALA